MSACLTNYITRWARGRAVLQGRAAAPPGGDTGCSASSLQHRLATVRAGRRVTAAITARPSFLQQLPLHRPAWRRQRRAVSAPIRVVRPGAGAGRVGTAPRALACLPVLAPICLRFSHPLQVQEHSHGRHLRQGGQPLGRAVRGAVRLHQVLLLMRAGSAASCRTVSRGRRRRGRPASPPSAPSQRRRRASRPARAAAHRQCVPSPSPGSLTWALPLLATCAQLVLKPPPPPLGGTSCPWLPYARPNITTHPHSKPRLTSM